MADITAHPLCWPSGMPRTRYRDYSRFGDHTIGTAFRTVFEQLRMMGCSHVVVSSNYAVKQDGIPYSKQPKSLDSEPGVAVYFKDSKGRDRAMACDKWTTAAHNAWAIAKSIEAMRGLERWGMADVLDRVFEGFAALPPRTPWYEVLGVPADCPLSAAEVAYRQLARVRHPDCGGSEHEMAELNAAIEEARDLHA